MRRCAIILAAVAIAGCAARPENITASYVSPQLYAGWECQQLNEEMLRVNAALATASAQQNKARTGDAWGVALIGLPVSSMTGNDATVQVASAKGQAEAIRQQMISKQCGST